MKTWQVVALLAAAGGGAVLLSRDKKKKALPPPPPPSQETNVPAQVRQNNAPPAEVNQPPGTEAEPKWTTNLNRVIGALRPEMTLTIMEDPQFQLWDGVVVSSIEPFKLPAGIHPSVDHWRVDSLELCAPSPGVSLRKWSFRVLGLDTAGETLTEKRIICTEGPEGLIPLYPTYFDPYDAHEATQALYEARLGELEQAMAAWPGLRTLHDWVRRLSPAVLILNPGEVSTPPETSDDVAALRSGGAVRLHPEMFSTLDVPASSRTAPPKAKSNRVLIDSEGTWYVWAPMGRRYLRVPLWPEGTGFIAWTAYREALDSPANTPGRTVYETGAMPGASPLVLREVLPSDAGGNMIYIPGVSPSGVAAHWALSEARRNLRSMFPA